MKIFVFLSFIIVTACSKNNTNSNGVSKELSDIKDEIVFEALSVRTSSVDGQNIVPSSTLDFATLQPKQSGTQDLIITNGLSTELVFGDSDIDASIIAPFVMTESCSNKTIARNRSCKLTFSVLNNPSPTETVLTKSLTIKGSVIQLTATLAADITPVNAPVVSLIVSPMHLDFGLMKSGEQKELSIAVTNRGTTTQNIIAPIISNPKLSIISNTCSSLARNRACSIRVRYSALSDESIIQQSFTSIANNDIKHSVLIQSPTVSEPQILTINPATSSSNLNLNEPQIQTSTLSFTNTGTVELPSPIQAIAQPSTGVTINSLSCTGGLSRGRNCSISYSLNSALITGGVSQVQLKLQSGAIASNSHIINLNVNKLAVPCTGLDAQANGWNTDNHLAISGMKTGSDVSQCVIQSCNQYFSINSSSKSCSADACTVGTAPNFGVNLSNIATVSGNTPNCIVSSCSNPSLYDIASDQKSCIDKQLDCTISDAQSNGWNITNAQTPTGIKVGPNLSQCSVLNCNTNFSLNLINKTCDTIACNSVNSIGNGVSSILNVSTFSGNLPTCSIASCESNFKLSEDSKSCVEKLCNELNVNELSSLGFNETNATIAGIYPNCTLACNSLLQQLSIDNKSCEDKTPIGTISFDQEYTKKLSPNIANITSTNGQQIQFYSDASCVVLTGSAISLPLSSINLELSSGDGSKDVYAKIINGNKSSECLTDSIILDQTLPSLAIISPILDTTIAGTSLIISGTCSESNSPTISVGITLNGTTQNTDCSLGMFSSIFNITSVPGGIQSIEVSATDLATNTNTVSSAFNKINCSSTQSVDENSCIDNIPTGSIAFDQTTTGTLTGNQLNIISTNAQQLQMYSDNLCSITTDLPYSLPLSFIDVIISGSYGVKTVYAKFINGTQSSNCLNSSITYEAPACSLSNADSYGVTLSKVISVSGITPNCAITSCESGYDISNDMKSCQPSFSFVSHKGFNNNISAIAKQSDGKIVYGGSFTSFTDNAGVTYSANRIARLNLDGTLDQTFALNIGSGFPTTVFALAIDSSNNIYVGGGFTSFNGGTNNANRIAKLNQNGTLDTMFMNNLDVVSGTKDANSGFSGTISALVIDSSNNIYIGGQFTRFKGVSSSANRIAKLSSTGVLDTVFMNNLDVVSGVKAASSGFDNNVLALARDSANNIYAGGFFTAFKGIANSAYSFAKLSSTGVLDTVFMNNLDVVSGVKDFSSAFNNTVYSIAIDSLNNVYVGGQFTAFRGVANSANRLAKLSSTGILDTAFMNNLDVVSGIKSSFSSGFNAIVNAIALDSSNNLYLGGQFISFKGVSNTNRIAKLSSTGILDTVFMNNLDVLSGTRVTTSGFDNSVLAIVVDSSNSVYVGGDFISLTNKSANYISKLSQSGLVLPYALSSSNFNGSVLSTVEDSLGNVYMGGSFTSFNGIAVNRLAKFNSLGNLDLNFNLEIGFGFGGAINALAIDSLNNVYVGGNFTSFNGGTNNANRIAKLNSNGTLDTIFMNNLDVVSGVNATSSGFINGVVSTIAIDSLNNVYVGGTFNSFKGGLNNTYRIAKFNSTGILDIIFMNNLDVVSGIKATTSGFNSAVSTIAIDSNNNIYVGGAFTIFKGISNTNRIAKLSSTGILDATFMNNLDVVSGIKSTTSGFGGSVNALGIDSFNNIYAGGAFTSFKGGGANRLVKLNSNGEIDTTFMNNLDLVPGIRNISSGLDSSVLALAIDSSNNVYIGGTFSSFVGGLNNANRIAKINSNGILDNTFMNNLDVVSGIKSTTSGFENSVLSLEIDSSNNVYIGGQFKEFKGKPAFRILYLLEDGVLP